MHRRSSGVAISLPPSSWTRPATYVTLLCRYRPRFQLLVSSGGSRGGGLQRPRHRLQQGLRRINEQTSERAARSPVRRCTVYSTSLVIVPSQLSSVLCCAPSWPYVARQQTSALFIIRSQQPPSTENTHTVQPAWAHDLDLASPALPALPALPLPPAAPPIVTSSSSRFTRSSKSACERTPTDEHHEQASLGQLKSCLQLGESGLLGT